MAPTTTKVGPVTVETTEKPAAEEEQQHQDSESGLAATSRARGGIKVRLTLGPALIDLEATLEEIVVVVTRLTQEFTKASIISS